MSPVFTIALLFQDPDKADTHVHLWHVPADIAQIIETWLTQTVGKPGAADIPNSAAEASFGIFGHLVRRSE